MTYTDVRLQLADNVIDELRSRGFLKPNEPLNAAIARVIVTVYPRRHPCDAHPGARASPVRSQTPITPPGPPRRPPQAPVPYREPGIVYCGCARKAAAAAFERPPISRPRSMGNTPRAWAKMLSGGVTATISKP